MRKKKIPIILAYLYIVLSIGIICGPTYYGLKSYQGWKQTRSVDASYVIKAIVQSTDGKVKLPSEDLGKMMGLSSDHPQNLFSFDLKEAKKKLKTYPIIKKVQLKRVKPSAIYVQYHLRTPFVQIVGHDNLGMDKEGFLFPLKPTYSDLSLPEVVMGSSCKLEDIKWKQSQKDPCTTLALKIFSELNECQNKQVFVVKKLDLSKAYASSYGKREILLYIEENLKITEELEYVFPKILRLSTKGYSKQLGDYLVLHDKMMADYKNQLGPDARGKGTLRFATTTVDLRIPSIAFIDNH